MKYPKTPYHDAKENDEGLKSFALIVTIAAFIVFSVPIVYILIKLFPLAVSLYEDIVEIIEDFLM